MNTWIDVEGAKPKFPTPRSWTPAFAGVTK